ncbi:MAG: substrate-binding domain-containing protein [Pseudomonadota bacterium]
MHKLTRVWRGRAFRQPPAATGLDKRDLETGGDAYRIALLVPTCGSAGLWAPSSIACAQLAVQELNERGGVNGRAARLVIVDAAVEVLAELEDLVEDLICAGAIDAIVGMHISAVRERLISVVRGRVPYIYTPLYEGGAMAPGVFAIGDTPDRQLGPAIDWLSAECSLRKWAFIGNDYVWPRVSHDYARRRVEALGCELAYERYLPFGSADIEEEATRIGASGAEAVLISLIGQDAVDFNRAFGAARMDRRMIRLSCAIEENGLLACGEENVRRLYSSSSYFSALETPANRAFKERYHSLHGDLAPMLNSIGQSLYEGVQFLGGLMSSRPDNWLAPEGALDPPVVYESVRRVEGEGLRTGQGAAPPIYLARAEGLGFEIVAEL